MKLTDTMRYPHPVLSEFSSDYVTGEFRCSFIQQMTAEGELKLTAELALDSTDLQALVDSQKASVGYFVVCRRTYFNMLQQAPLERLAQLDSSMPRVIAPTDLANSKIVGKALARLTPTLANEERIWVRLSHVEAFVRRSSTSEGGSAPPSRNN